MVKSKVKAAAAKSPSINDRSEVISNSAKIQDEMKEHAGPVLLPFFRLVPYFALIEMESNQMAQIALLLRAKCILLAGQRPDSDGSKRLPQKKVKRSYSL